MTAHRTIFAAVAAAVHYRPLRVEVGHRWDRDTGKFTPDMRRWEDPSTYKGDIARTLSSRSLNDMPVGTALDCYVYRRSADWGSELDMNCTVTRTPEGWVAREGA